MERCLYHSIILFASVLPAHPINAVEYTLTPTASLQTIVNDNGRFTGKPHESVIGNIADGGLEAGVNSSKTVLKMTYGLRAARYHKDIGLDGNDHYINAVVSQAVSERQKINVSAMNRYESVSMEEIAGTTAVFAKIRHKTKSISPTYMLDLSQRLGLKLDYSYNSVSYTGGEVLRFNDYVSRQGGVVLDYDLNKSTGVSARIRISGLDSPQAGNRSDTYAIYAGYATQLSDTLRVSAELGRLYSTSHFVVSPSAEIRQTDNGVLAFVSVNKRFEKFDIDLQHERSVSPGNSGVEDLRESYAANFNRPVSSRFSIDLSVDYNRNKSLNSFAELTRESNMLSAGGGVVYDVTDRWVMEGRYLHQRIGRINDNETVSSNSVYLNLRYRFDVRRVSR